MFPFDLPPQLGGTKKQEYLRTIELLEEIFEAKGIYFALAFLYDAGYDRKDIHNMMELIHPNDGRRIS